MLLKNIDIIDNMLSDMTPCEQCQKFGLCSDIKTNSGALIPANLYKQKIKSVYDISAILEKYTATNGTPTLNDMAKIERYINDERKSRNLSTPRITREILLLGWTPGTVKYEMAKPKVRTRKLKSETEKPKPKKAKAKKQEVQT